LVNLEWINKNPDRMMKKHAICAALAFAALAVACTKVAVEDPSGNGRTDLTFHASSNPATRTELVENNAVDWVAGDKISVFDAAGSNNPFQTDQSGASVEFSGSVSREGTYYALYPYNESASIDGSTISTELPAVQTAYPGSFASGLNPSVAVADAQNNLFFRNVCALVKFTLGSTSVNVVKATLSGNAGENLAGAVTVNAASDSPVAVADADFGATSVELYGTLSAGKTYYFVVAPGTLSAGLTLSLYDSAGNVWAKQGSSEVTIDAGHILNLGEVDPGQFEPVNGYELVDGTYHVYNGDGLLAWAADENVLNKSVVLENDIDLSGKEWMPVGSDMSTNGYAGEFDGNGKYIYNLTVAGSDAANVGFFGALASGGKVHDVKFSGAEVVGGPESYAGVVAGASLGVIDGCNVLDSKVSGNYAGAITGNNSVQVNNSNARDVQITGTYAAGGIAGTSYGKIEYCTLSGDSKVIASGSSSRAGGIVGTTSQESSVSTSGRLLKCAVDGATVSGVWAGGIAGENSFGIVAQCIVNQAVITHASSAASARLGGVVGYNSRGNVVASYSAYSTIGADGLVSETEGGIVGYNNNSASYVYGCYSTHVSLLGSVSGNESGVGSIAGYTSGHVTSCYAVLPDGVSGIGLVGKYGLYGPDHCVEPGGVNYTTLTDNVPDLDADDGSVWEASKIWDLTASGAPAIVATYISNPPESSTGE